MKKQNIKKKREKTEQNTIIGLFMGITLKL